MSARTLFDPRDLLNLDSTPAPIDDAKMRQWVTTGGGDDNNTRWARQSGQQKPGAEDAFDQKGKPAPSKPTDLDKAWLAGLGALYEKAGPPGGMEGYGGWRADRGKAPPEWPATLEGTQGYSR